MIRYIGFKVNFPWKRERMSFSEIGIEFIGPVRQRWRR